MVHDAPNRDGALSDIEIIQKARTAENGRKFNLLFDEPYEDSILEQRYNTRWQAEVALLANFAFWTGRDRDQMWRLFKRSAIYHERIEIYREYPDYQEGLITEALELNQEVYGSGDSAGDDADASAVA